MVQMTVEIFVANYFSPTSPPSSRGCTFIGRVVALIVDQLRKRRRSLVSQSVNAGYRWRGKYCFVRRGEQIIGEYSKTITFLNIPGILFNVKMQCAFH